MTLSKKQFQETHGKLASQGGFTINPGTGESVTEGISVAPAGNERQLRGKESTPEALAAYHAENTERFGRGASLGGWRNKGTDYLDTPTVYPNTPGGVSRSRRQMLASSQIASFNLSTFTESFNPYHPENRTGDIVAHDTPEQRETWQEMPRRVGRTEQGETTYKSPNLKPRLVKKRSLGTKDRTGQGVSFS